MDFSTYEKLVSEILRYFPNLYTITDLSAIFDIERGGFSSVEYQCGLYGASMGIRLIPLDTVYADDTHSQKILTSVKIEGVFTRQKVKELSFASVVEFDRGEGSDSQILRVVMGVSDVIRRIYDSLSDEVRISRNGEILKELWYIRDRENDHTMPRSVRDFTYALYSAYGFSIDRYHSFGDTSLLNVHNGNVGARFRLLYGYAVLERVYIIPAGKGIMVWKDREVERPIPYVGIECQSTYFRLGITPYNFRPLTVWLKMLVAKAEKKYSRFRKEDSLPVLNLARYIPDWRSRKESKTLPIPIDRTPIKKAVNAYEFEKLPNLISTLGLGVRIMIFDCDTGEIYLDGRTEDYRREDWEGLRVFSVKPFICDGVQILVRWKDELSMNLNTLKNISKLKPNWNMNGAEAFTSEHISVVDNILRGLERQPEVFPTACGSIQLEYTVGDRYLEFEVFEDGRVKMFSVDENGVEDTAEIPKESINIVVKKFSGVNDENN